ncbi:LysE/ArgO family amino acid transporter [Streptomyces griseomycini]|uniref:L-lysine exporter family protein LysE/ArgO n=1 Tax=Streptomyces griseomycini TaxID=66895 RepID=A0A7W7M061_9ACTN|nr:LysE/ArgO family amino acid transporter [Streptomyces griseomycini]MBB4899532.1 L-lysine exporter family protein LysE/ArgO [Streptomyces griseomycini]GGR08362.1 amino acid transporter [Streptomyces griseomycini]
MTSTLTTAAAGFGTGLSLIVAIGAQNAFVLRQGVRREAVPAVVAICALSDAALIALGVGGIGAVVVAWPGALTAVGWIGGAFLLGYGALAARRVVRPSGAGLETEGESARSRRRAVLTCLAMTWLNPHVYLDTVFLLGSVAADHGPLRWTFGLGAVLASVCWFAALGFGARLLSRFLARPAAWRVLDALVATTMIVLGVTLLAGS